MLSRDDRDEIADVVLRYASGIDRRDWAAFRSCFTDDAVGDYASNIRPVGGDAITAFIKGLHDDVGPMLHRVSNIDIREVARGAEVRSYVDGLLMWPDGRFKYQTEGYYDDLMVRTSQGWKIAHRSFVPVRFTGERPPQHTQGT